MWSVGDWLLGLAVAGAVALAMGLVLFRLLTRRARARGHGLYGVRPLPSSVRLVAVIPFGTDSRRPDLAALSSGLTALVRRHLSCISGLSVLTAEETAAAGEDFGDVVSKTGRDAVVLATLDEVGAGIRVAGEVRGPWVSGWLGPYEGELADAGTIAERIAFDATAALGIGVDAQERRAVRECRPKSAASLARLGMALSEPDTARAIARLEDASKEDGRFALLLLTLARLIAATDAPRAASLLERAIALDPSHALPYWQLATLYTLDGSGRAREALGLVTKSLDLAPAFGQARLLHANFLAALGGAGAEVAARAQTVALLPGNPEAWALQGAVLARRGDATGAFAAFQRALSLDPDHREALEGIVPVARALGRYADVVRWAERWMEAEDPRIAGADRNPARFIRAAREGLAAASSAGDRAALERIAAKALAVDPKLDAARKALES